MSNPHTKFGWILSNGLGGDSVMDGQRPLQYPQRFFKKSVGIIRFIFIECVKKSNITIKILSTVCFV